MLHYFVALAVVTLVFLFFHRFFAYYYVAKLNSLAAEKIAQARHEDAETTSHYLSLLDEEKTALPPNEDQSQGSIAEWIASGLAAALGGFLAARWWASGNSPTGPE